MGAVISLSADGLPGEVRASGLARVLGLSPQRIRELASEGVLHRTRHGWYDLEASIQGLIGFWQSRVGRKDPEADHVEHLRSLHLRKLELEAKTAEMVLEERVSNLYPTNQISSSWNRSRSTARHRIEQLVEDFSADCDVPDEVTEHLSSLLEDALSELDRHNPFPEAGDG